MSNLNNEIRVGSLVKHYSDDNRPYLVLFIDVTEKSTWIFLLKKSIAREEFYYIASLGQCELYVY